MDSTYSYLPILLDKRAELHALAALGNVQGDRVRPLIQIRSPEPPDKRLATWSPASALKDRVLGDQDGLVGCVGTSPTFIDTADVDVRLFESGSQPIADFFDLCAEVGIPAIPVTGRDRPTEHRSAAAAATRRLGNGACIRLRGSELGVGLSGVAPLLRELDLPRSEIDLIFDLQNILVDNIFLLSTVAAQFVRQFGAVGDWRSVVVAASSFPPELYKLVANDSHEVVPRAEVDLWRRVRMAEDGLSGVRFGDYGVVDAIPQPSFKGAANLRYTIEAAWLVLRGPHREDAGSFDYVELGRQLMGLEGWRGREHCPGCAFLARQVSSGRPGNATQWRSASFSHHIATVLEEQASRSNLQLA